MAALAKKSVQRESQPRGAEFPDVALSPDVYRQIYAALDLDPDSGPIIGVTSSIRGEGRTTLAVGLAQSLAGDLTTNIILIEADLGQGSLARHFGIPQSPGLGQVLQGYVDFDEVSYSISEHLFVVPGGVSESEGQRILAQVTLQNPFRDRANLSGIVILDLPPIMPQGYSAVAANSTDAVVFVVRAGMAAVCVLREAVARLQEGPPIGVVVNGANSPLPGWWPGGGV